MDLGKLNEAKKKKPDADGDGVPDWADKKPGKDDHSDEEKIEEISMGKPSGETESPSDRKEEFKKLNADRKKREAEKKKPTIMKESDQTQQEMADMIKQSDKSADEIAAQIIARFFDSIRPEDEAPPSDDFDGGNSGAPAQPSLQEQEEQTDDKLKGTSGGRYTTKDPELTQKVQDLAIGIIKNPSLIKSLTGIETIIQNMIGALGTSEKTLSQTKTDMAKAQSDLQEKKLRQSIRKILKEKK
jgi:hypothetical protein